MTPYFSVILPFYNASETIRESLDSLSKQEFRNFEVIGINDGSNDNSRKIWEKWVKENPEIRVRFQEQENKGLGAARNAAIELASGKFCCLLDADDLWHEKKLSTVHLFLQKNPQSSVVFHQVESFGLNTNRPRRIHHISNIPDLLIKGNPIVPSATIIKTELLKRMRFTDNKAFHGAEDLHLWIRLLYYKHQIKALPVCLTSYRETGGMSNKIEEHLFKVFSVLQHFYEKKYYDQELLARAKRRKFLEVARFYQKRKVFRKAEEYYNAADFKSMKVAGLRFLNLLGISI